MARRVPAQSSSVRNTWATFPVITARSAQPGGAAAASPCTQVTRLRSSLARATSSEAAAGSTPTTLRPVPASARASDPVPQPTSSTRRAPSSAAMPR
jgi:hypothetical protein